jgi:hypothetical protein
MGQKCSNRCHTPTWVVVIEPAKKVAEQYTLVRREHPALKPPDA